MTAKNLDDVVDVLRSALENAQALRETMKEKEALESNLMSDVQALADLLRAM